MLFKTLYFVICSAEDLFTLNSNKFRMVYEVDGNPQLDTCDWSMYSNILNAEYLRKKYYFRSKGEFAGLQILAHTCESLAILNLS